ncbi:MAG: Twin-arginine translocation pathway signal, partial [Sphingomonadaceae bacterium]
DDGVAQLNAIAEASYGESYVTIRSEGERVTVLCTIEQTAFFQKIRNDLMFSFYNNKEVWPFFGYEGSSWEQGGYLERGFNDIDWL